MNNTLEQLDILIGDTPVSEQLDAALSHMATKGHVHSEYATCNEVNELKRKIDMLIDLVGDAPVSVQIYEALNHIK